MFLFSKSAYGQLDDVYRRQEAAKARSNDCENWNKAQWLDEGSILAVLSRMGRIRQLPDGRLLFVEIFVDQKLDGTNMKIKCGVRSTSSYTAGEAKIGYKKSLFSDGSGSESTVKIEGDQLVTYYSLCSEWICKRRWVTRRVLGVRLTADLRKRQDDAVINAKNCIASGLHRCRLEVDTPNDGSRLPLLTP